MCVNFVLKKYQYRKRVRSHRRLLSAAIMSGPEAIETEGYMHLSGAVAFNRLSPDAACGNTQTLLVKKQFFR
jgi:hypothetical protein